MDQSLSFGPLALFGSGELDPSGRRVHELLVKNFPAPVKIALVTTPAGFEANPNFWYAKLKRFLEQGLVNFRSRRRNGLKRSQSFKLVIFPRIQPNLSTLIN